MLGRTGRGAANHTLDVLSSMRFTSASCKQHSVATKVCVLRLPGSRLLSALSSASSTSGPTDAEPLDAKQFAEMLDPKISPLHAVCAEVAASRKAANLHEPVMPAAALNAWVPPHVAPDGEGAVFVDATIGHAGHSEALLRALPKARLVGLDADGEMVAKAQKALAQAGVAERATLIKAPFSHLHEVLSDAGVGSVDGILADIGFNTGHVANAARGFAFRKDGRLDGRFDTAIQGSTSIVDIVNKCSFAQLVSLLRHKGGETHHERAIARAIIEWRGKGARKRRITSTLELRFVVESALAVALGDAPIASSRADARFARRQAKHKSADFKRKGRLQGVWDRESVWVTKADQDKMLKKLAATKSRYTPELQRTFQAFRIAVNAEDWHVAQVLQALPTVLSPGGRFACMVFAPHEDAMLRRAAAAYMERGWGVVGPGEGLRAHPREVRANARCRSARLHTLVAPAEVSDGISLADTGFNVHLEPYLMPQALSLRRALPPGGAQLLLGAFAAKAAKDAARSAGNQENTSATHDAAASAGSNTDRRRVTLESVQHKLAPGLQSVEFVDDEGEGGYSSGEWGGSGSSDDGTAGASSSDGEWEEGAGADLDAREEEELMFHTMTQSLRVTLSDDNGGEQSKIVTVRGDTAPVHTPAPER